MPSICDCADTDLHGNGNEAKTILNPEQNKSVAHKTRVHCARDILLDAKLEQIHFFSFMHFSLIYSLETNGEIKMASFWTGLELNRPMEARKKQQHVYEMINREREIEGKKNTAKYDGYLLGNIKQNRHYNNAWSFDIDAGGGGGDGVLKLFE